MATEQYAIGYDEGYQDGWNAALEPAPPSKQEPLCWLKETGSIGGGYEQTAWGDTSGFPVYTAPPSKPWVSLTDEQIRNFYWPYKPTLIEYVRFIEAKSKELNHG